MPITPTPTPTPLPIPLNGAVLLNGGTPPDLAGPAINFTASATASTKASADLPTAAPAADAKPANARRPHHGPPDFERIKEAARAHADSLLRDWFPAGRMVGHEFRVGSLAGERGSSLSINTRTGMWKDFADNGQSGNDLIGLFAAKACPGQQGEAARRIADRLGISPYRNGGDHTPAPKSPPVMPKVKPKPVLTPIFPPPDSAGPPPPVMLAGFDMVHQYTDTSGCVTHYVGRIEARNGARKLFVPISYGTADGITGWHKLGLTGPLPLYGLHKLTTMPTAPVVLVEGEKKCDAAQAMLPHIAFLSWCRGAGSDGTADLPPLAGHDIKAVWGDADEKGRAAALRLSKRLGGVPIVRTDDLTDGFDAADLAKLVDAGEVADPNAWLEARIIRPPPGGNQPDEQNQTQPPLTPPPQLHDCTLADLENKEIPPLRWIVPDYIPEGLTILAGKPKIGKSWAILNVALGVARGTEALGKLIDKGDVLYCALEDGERRMKARVAKVLGPTIKGWPANFTCRYYLDPIDAGGLEQLEKWLIAHPNRRLVGIDVLGRVRGTKGRNEEPYQYDYRLVGALQALAIRYRVAIVLVHHVRKSAADDVLDTVSGTTGIAGAADTVLVLGREAKGVRLIGRGRDTEDLDKLMEFDRETGIWAVTADFDADEPGGGLQGLARDIFDLLAASATPMTPLQIADRLGKPYSNVKTALWRMKQASPPQIASSARIAGAYEAIRR